MITLYEFIAGTILNIVLGLNVWDYSNLPLNILGQICLPFSIIWYFLSIIGICLDDFLEKKNLGTKYFNVINLRGTRN